MATGNHELEIFAMLLAPWAEACHLCILQSPRRHPRLHEGSANCLPLGTCSVENGWKFSACWPKCRSFYVLYNLWYIYMLNMCSVWYLSLEKRKKRTCSHTPEVSLMSLLRCLPGSIVGNANAACKSHLKSLELLVSGIQSLWPISQFQQGYTQ